MIDTYLAPYIIKNAIDEHKPPAQIINELVGEKLAVAV